MNRTHQTVKYVLFDFLGAAAAWGIFYIYRKIYIESVKYGFDVPIDFGLKFYLGLFIIPLFWITVYYLTGQYKNIFRKSRLKELAHTFSISLLGVVIIFFALILDDTISTYKNYYNSFAALFTFHFTLTYIPRLILTSLTINKLRSRKIGFNTLLIGSNGRALNLFQEFESQPKSTGNKFIGFTNVHENISHELSQNLPHLGNINDLKTIIKKHKIEEAIIAIESSEHEEVWKIINKLEETNVIIKVIPNMYDILTGCVNMNTIFSTPLIEINHDLMTAWEENVKRLIDIFVSFLAMIILSPLYIFLATGVKLSSKGPVIYSHERIGRYGKPFTIYKFRSMYIDAEKHGPQLSSKDDTRITPFGLFMRRSRLDELPQFFNVLIGDMSLVGPRPERQYYIDRIVEQAPHYYHLQKVRPGITSWGQVKFGYAENVEQMIERLKYDIIYIENMSLYNDMKILIYTIKTVISGKGR